MPQSRSAAPISASTQATSSADSTFGITRPSSSGHTTAAMSSAPWSAEKPVLAATVGFTRTYTRPPSAARVAAAVTFALAATFWSNGTESSRSRITPSAPNEPTLASFRGSLPGANSRDLTTIQLSGSPCRRRHSTADCPPLAAAAPLPAATHDVEHASEAQVPEHLHLVGMLLVDAVVYASKIAALAGVEPARPHVDVLRLDLEIAASDGSRPLGGVTEQT